MLSFIEYLSEQAEVDTSHDEKTNTITLNKIVVPKEKRGQGHGSAAMRNLTKHADEHKKRIVLTPDTSFGGSSVSRLKKFYKGHGFKDNKGRSKDFTTRHTMIRDPQ